MNAPLDYTIPAEEIPQVRLRALEDAWADDKKLADACDDDVVLRLLRQIHYGIHDDESLAGVADAIDDEITEVFRDDPSFSDWCEEAREQMSKEPGDDGEAV